MNANEMPWLPSRMVLWVLTLSDERRARILPLSDAAILRKLQHGDTRRPPQFRLIKWPRLKRL